MGDGMQDRNDFTDDGADQNLREIFKAAIIEGKTRTEKMSRQGCASGGSRN
jgi:hypothetical protein